MTVEPLRVACIGMGWWSDVLADAIKRSGKLKIVACYTRSEDKRQKFAAKYGCRAAPSYEAILADPAIEAIINTTPNDVHLPTTRAAAAAGKHVFLDKPIANTVTEGRAITEGCRKAGVVLALGYQRRRESHFRWIRRQIDDGVFGKLVNAEANISRDRLGKIDLELLALPGGRHAGRRDAADRHPLHRRARISHRADQGGERPLRAARAAGRQPGCREPRARARERRALHAQCELCLGFRILSDEHLRQGGERLLRPAPGPADAQARRGTAGRCPVRDQRRVRRGARRVRRRGSR